MVSPPNAVPYLGPTYGPTASVWATTHTGNLAAHNTHGGACAGDTVVHTNTPFGLHSAAHGRRGGHATRPCAHLRIPSSSSALPASSSIIFPMVMRDGKPWGFMTRSGHTPCPRRVPTQRTQDAAWACARTHTHSLTNHTSKQTHAHRCATTVTSTYTRTRTRTRTRRRAHKLTHMAGTAPPL